jgi:predicted cobalt transporter CbtA
MNSLAFLFVSLISGIIAGLILAGLNYLVAEPVIDQAISIEVENSLASGDAVDYEELSNYRIWQKGGTFTAGAIIGLTYGAIMGIVYVVTRKYLPSSDDRKKAMMLAALMCLSLYVVPFLKYPANPPAVGDPDTIGLRQSLYTCYQLASGLIVLSLSVILYKFRMINYVKFSIPILFVVLVVFIYHVFPSNPDIINIPMDLVNMFRGLTFTTTVIFYLVLGAIFGSMWHYFRPHEPTRITAN